MELFDKKFVRFMWDDELKGKQCFAADNICVLKACVESCKSRSGRVVESGDNGYPFLYDDADERCGSMYQFAYYDPNFEVKKAFNEGKPIQVTPKGTDKWVDLHCEPTWDVDLEYRVKPEEKQYRPYESSAEMIADFKERFKVNCPSYCEPLIWLKGHNTDNRYLVTSFLSEVGDHDGDGVRVGVGFCGFQDLFKCYTYLDGSPVGMEC